MSQSIFNAQIDLNPHQVEAALFAFKSPLSSGVILADEVGLGKTIEAGLVLTQYWSERKRKIIIVAPSSLRKQWSMELKEKFFLDSFILDGKSYKDETTNGNKNPFEQKDKIVITSYQFASRHKEALYLAGFQLAVIDEAHKLRNYHRGEKSKMSFAIAKALRDRKKVLLTATPLQNSLLEIYGLVSILDEYVFGDKRSFQKQFSSTALTRSDINDLKERLKPIVKRTLRKDVVEYINYTKRIPIVEEFTPSKEEIALYDLISDFLLSEDLYSIPSSQRTLITLVARKLLASSTKAIMGTLETLIKRLRKIVDEKKISQADLNVETDDEDELIEEYLEEENELEEPFQEIELLDKDIEAINKEIEELETFIELAKTIEIDTKVKSLMSALEKGFEEQKKLGVKEQKAIIFTESRRTQQFLYDYLTANGFEDKVVLFNGTNTDKKSKEIYDAWLEEHKGSDMITGAKSADMKQAIVDFFKEKASIMIATEAGSEGINLQFCNMLINYDLPWNPQRIEQRIGRVHRYGQKFDVVVINFLNKKNAADRRVYELLSNKFNLFEGVFGASDEVLGSIESGVDFEKRILQIFQTCRDDKEIEEAFNELQSEFSEKINQKTLQTRQTLLDNFDEDVHLRLKDTKLKSNDTIDRFSSIFWDITKAELKDKAIFDEEKKEFKYNGSKYQLISHKQNHPNTNALTYRLNSPLGEEIINQAKERELQHSKLIFDLINHKYKISSLEKFKNKKGYLSATKVSIQSYDFEEYIIITALTNDYHLIDEEEAMKLLSLEAISSTKSSIDNNDIEKLDYEYRAQKAIILKSNEATNQTHFIDQSAKLHKWADDRLAGIEKELKDTKAKIKELNRQSLATESIEEQTEIQLQIKAQEKKRKKIQREIFDIEEEIEEQRDELIEELKKAKEQTITTDKLFTIEWELK
ncbi:MAG: DEAD/DEAH box helicase [Campylobacterales bacterium]|nr:DEAD/DEAH box helicase [Campylobacterales bacterium]